MLFKEINLFLFYSNSENSSLLKTIAAAVMASQRRGMLEIEFLNRWLFFQVFPTSYDSYWSFF